LRAYKNRYL